MLKKRDAQGLPINVIILAAIALIVLVVIIAIFTRETGRTVGALGSCEGRGGTCVHTSSDCDEGKIMPELECQEENQLCCYSID